MAVVPAGEQYLAIRTVKNLLWSRERPKFCCRAIFSNVERKKNHSKGANGLFIQPENFPNEPGKSLNGAGTGGGNASQFSFSSKEMRIAQLLINELQAEPKFVFNEILKHPKRKFINIVGVKKSLQFLLDIGFSKEVIADSAAVCFYPQEYIKHGLEEIKRNESELNKIGFVNGFVKKTCSAFPCGSVSRDKRLQLCIYYMELPFAFNGSGVFHSY